MLIEVTIKNVETFHTDEGSHIDQPGIAVTLAVKKAGDIRQSEIVFTELLSNLFGMTDAELLAWIENAVNSYVKTSYKGTEQLDSETGEWTKAAVIVGKTFTLDIS